MAKEKSLAEIEAELAKMEAELKTLKHAPPSAPSAEAHGMPRGDGPAEATAPPRRGSFLSKLRRTPAEEPESPPAPVAAAEAPAPEAPPEPAPEPVPVVVPSSSDRIPPPSGTWVQEGKAWRRVAGGPPAVQVEGAPEPVPGEEAPAPEDLPPERNRRRLLLILIPIGVVLLAALALAASTYLGGDSAQGGSDDSPPANRTTPAGDLKAAFVMAPARATPIFKVNEAVRFDASSSTVPAGEAAAYNWDFGDGGKATGRSVTHPYRTAGNYTVRLTVTAAGVQASLAKDLRVVPPPTAALAVSKGGSPAAVVFMGETLTFDSTGSSGTGALAFDWDFGDGSKGTGASATHAYAAAGRYTAILKVTDGSGVEATKSRLLYVGMRQPIDGSAPTSADGAKNVTFPFNPASGGLFPTRITANITYSPSVQAGGGLLPGLPIDPTADNLHLYIVDSTGAILAEGRGANGAARVELTTIDPMTLAGEWTLVVSRPQGASTAAKAFTGLLEIELPPSP